mmetsp:Transcript_142600/g.201744  ORF Transcript_142600/g.201744 Transcript_142600/m.201744 type:complete len:102 (+) Transcript_142600:3-308(+)
MGGMGCSSCMGMPQGGMGAQAGAGYNAGSMPSSGWGNFQQQQKPPAGPSPAMNFSTGPANSAEDLMSKTMAGVANLSLEQRQAQSSNTSSSQSRGLPIGLM